MHYGKQAPQSRCTPRYFRVPYRFSQISFTGLFVFHMCWHRPCCYSSAQQPWSRPMQGTDAELLISLPLSFSVCLRPRCYIAGSAICFHRLSRTRQRVSGTPVRREYWEPPRKSPRLWIYWNISARQLLYVPTILPRSKFPVFNAIIGNKIMLTVAGFDLSVSVPVPHDLSWK